MIYIIIIILFSLYILYRIKLSNKRKESEIKLKYARDVEYIIRVIKSCVNYKQLVNLNKWWHTYLNNSYIFSTDYFKVVEDRARIESIVQNKLFEIQKKDSDKQKELLNQTPIKLTKQQLDSLKEKVENSELLHLRKGQMYFNELYNMNSLLANSIRGTKFDPFYADHKNNPEEEINKFLDYISKN